MSKMYLDAFNEAPTLNPWMYDSFKETPEGYLQGRAVVTNIGIFPYLVDGRIENRLRTPEDVLDAESLDSLRNKPLTNDHPSVAVDADNIETYQVGHLGTDIRVDGYSVSADIIITHSDTIAMVKAGKVALSCGYFSELKDVSGTKWGQPYDSMQTNIRYNHVAIVDAGRAGDDAQMQLDSKTNFICGLSVKDKQKPQEKQIDTEVDDSKENIMEYRKITVDSKIVEVQADAADEVIALVEARDTASAKAVKLEGEVTALDTKATGLEAQVDGLTADLAAAKKAKDEAVSSLDAQIVAGIESRLAVIAVAKELEVAFDAKDTNIDIQKKVVLSQYDNSEEISAKMDEKGAVYVDGLFDRIVFASQDSKENAKEVGKEVLNADGKGPEQKDKVLSMDEARAAYENSILKKEVK
jgi:hypothetical protein